MGTVMSDKNDKARQLLELLGLTEEQIDAALAGTLNVTSKLTQPKPKRTLYKEYILSRSYTCKTCVSKWQVNYHMKQMEENSGLISTEVTDESVKDSKLAIQRDWQHRTTCSRCHGNLILLTRDDLATMLLETINERERYKNG